MTGHSIHKALLMKKASHPILIPAILLVASYIYFLISSPGDIVVTNSGEIQGTTNRLRLHLQGEKFWKDQIDIAKQEIEKIKNRKFNTAIIIASGETADRINKEAIQQMEERRKAYLKKMQPEIDQINEIIRAIQSRR